MVDFAGLTVRELKASGEPGLHRVSWDLTRLSLRISGLRRQPFSEPVVSGMYRVILTVNGTDFAQGMRVDRDPTLPAETPAEVPQTPARKKVNAVDD